MSNTMPSYDFKAPRLLVCDDLKTGALILGPDHAHYLGRVLRKRSGDSVLLFNGRDGEWVARVEEMGKRSCTVCVVERVREQPAAPDLWVAFAPLKKARMDYVVQKAAEMGASRLMPMMTRFTMVDRVNRDRMVANVREAVEQCGVLSVPDVDAPVPFDMLVSSWPSGRAIVFCDERADARDGIDRLTTLSGTPMGIVIGPEGGFSDEERDRLLAHDQVLRVGLGPRILRADTAMVAALTLVQALAGDWRSESNA